MHYKDTFPFLKNYMMFLPRHNKMQSTQFLLHLHEFGQTVRFYHPLSLQQKQYFRFRQLPHSAILGHYEHLPHHLRLPAMHAVEPGQSTLQPLNQFHCFPADSSAYWRKFHLFPVLYVSALDYPQVVLL